MSRELKSEIDLDGLNKFNSSMLGALIGTGQGTMGDAQRFIATEAGQLAWDISQALGPKTLKAGKDKIAKAARAVFFPINVPVFTGAKAGSGDMKWLFASQKNNSMLVGADREDVQPNLAGAEMQDAFKRASRKRGAAWQNLGTVTRYSLDKSGRMRPHYSRRGTQHVFRINRIVVKPGALSALVKITSQKTGQLRASFGYAASQLVPSKRIPAWVAKHFPTKANGRAIYNNQLLAAENPYIEFGSSAKGVNSNPYIVDIIARTVARRKEIIRGKVKKIVQGYTYNWNTGQVFRQVVPTEGL